MRRVRRVKLFNFLNCGESVEYQEFPLPTGGVEQQAGSKSAIGSAQGFYLSVPPQ